VFGAQDDPYTDLDFQGSYDFAAADDLDDAVNAWADHFEALGGGPIRPQQSDVDDSSCAADCSLAFDTYCAGSSLVSFSRGPGCRDVGVCNRVVSRRSCDAFGFICSAAEADCIEPGARGCDCSDQPLSECVTDTRVLYYEPPSSCAAGDSCQWTPREVDCPTGSECFGGSCEFF